MGKKKNRKKLKVNKMISSLLVVLFYALGIGFLTLGFVIIVIKGNPSKKVKLESVDLSKYVNDEKIIEGHKKVNSNNLEPVMYDDFLEAVENSKYFPTSFVGKLTHYGPDCALCGGYLGCNGQDARNGNIYYNDEEYGTLRIVASSSKIPCGSIVRINIDEYDLNGMYAIVLDRGVGASHIDLLKTSEKAWSPVRTINNVVFDIVRYGY